MGNRDFWGDLLNREAAWAAVPDDAALDEMVRVMLDTIFPAGNRPDTPLRHALEDGALHAALCVLYERGLLSSQPLTDEEREALDAFITGMLATVPIDFEPGDPLNGPFASARSKLQARLSKLSRGSEDG